jgi:hypothetical protein
LLAARSKVLQTRTGLLSALLWAATLKLLERPDLRGLVVAHLVLLHQIIRASVPLLETAFRQTRNRDDDLCRSLTPYLERHIDEERDHDEWTLQDLESAGIGRAQALAAAPPPDVAALAGAQYYWILHHHPVALIGYIAVLEGNTPSQDLIDQLRSRTGLPDSAFRTLRLHAIEDPEHRAALDRLIDVLPLDAQQERLIAVSAMHTGAKLADCLSQLRPWSGTALPAATETPVRTLGCHSSTRTG